ncbi:MAG: polysaccharide biosynthesis protein [Clostridia bacterium]|nr:polysaccharide biosynthesis protein [Clostridia bacterium]
MVENRQKNLTKTFFSGVLLLSVSTALVKLIGLIYKIPMLSYLGAEGMGYFNSAYEIYALFCVISTAGLPVALSVLISGALSRGAGQTVKRIYRAAMGAFLLIGLLGSGLMLLFARQFCKLIQSENAYACILSIAPTVFFVCVSSALRGYFQGYQKMLPTALSQLLESVGKLAFGLLFAQIGLQRGYNTATVAALAGLGLTLGTAISALYLILEKLRFHPAEEDVQKDSASPSAVERTASIWKSLARLAIPMTLGASLVSLTKLIDMTMILRRLQAIGYSEVMANEAYGSYTTLALSVFGLLPSMINSIALPLVPMLSAAAAAKDRERELQMVSTSFRLTSLIAIPAALGITAFSHPILSLLFGGDPQAVAVSAPLLSCLGISVFLSCMITATNSVLHAYQAVNLPILSLLAGAIAKIVVAYSLIGNPLFGMLGAPISTFFCNAIVVLLNLYFCSGLSQLPSVSTVFFRPLLSGGLAVGVAYTVYALLASVTSGSGLLTVGGILLSCVLYLILSCKLGAVWAEDILALPMGKQLYALLTRLHLLSTKE